MTQRSIVEAAARLRRRREPYLVATVVATRGSVYRRPGARMLLTQFRWICGAVSGGCLEGDIAAKGWWRTQSGEPIVVTYDSSVPADADDDDVRSAFGLGCDGVVEVMLERAGLPGRIDPLELAETCLARQKRAAVATVYRSHDPAIRVGARMAVMGGEVMGDVPEGAVRDALVAEARAAIESGVSATRSYEGIEVFVEAIVPPPHLYVFGTGHDAVPVVEMARGIGWDVSVCTNHLRISTRDRFVIADEILIGPTAELAGRIDAQDRAVAVVMGHNYEVDRQSVGVLAGTRACYIGVLGPRTRTTRMLTELGLAAHDDPRIHAPVGLELGAETPQEIALAIVAEIQSVLRRAPGTSLRDRVGSIHDRPVAAAS